MRERMILHHLRDLTQEFILKMDFTIIQHLIS